MDIKFEFYAELTARIELTDAEFDYLYEAFKRHYDRTIQMAAAHGGWLYGLKVRRTPWPGATHDDVDKCIEVKDRQLQLVIKSLELHNTTLAFELTSKMCNVHAQLCKNTKMLNSILFDGQNKDKQKLKSGDMVKCERPFAHCENLTAGKSYRVYRTDAERQRFTIVDDNGCKKTYKMNNSQFEINKL